MKLQCKLPEEDLQACIDTLIESKVIKITDEKVPCYICSEFEVEYGEAAGWEAAAFDHFQALVTTMISRLNTEGQATRQSETGGSTYHFDVWEEHPLQEEVKLTLGRFRRELDELRQRVEAHNDQVQMPDEMERITTYVGQASKKVDRD